VALDGTTGTSAFVPAAVFNAGGSYAISVWVKFARLSSSSNNTFVSMDGTGYGYAGNISPFYLQAASGKLTLVERSSNSTSSTASTITGPSLSAGTWSNVIAEYNASTDEAYLYLNGTLEGSVAFSSPWAACSTQFGDAIYNGAQVWLPVAGTAFTADQIADTGSVCSWNPDNYGLNHDHPGAQAYYDAQVAQFARWGVDFIKADDMLAPYHDREISAYARAIAHSGRPIELSLSPGTDLSLAHLEHLRESAAMWRVCDDLWDRWEHVEAQFARMARWAPRQGVRGWADADMLPLGRIGIRAERGEDRLCGLTRPGQISLMTLWLISRSPLMMGGDLPTSPPETIALLTNDEALSVLWHSTDNKEVLREKDLVLWTARDSDGVTRYAAVFSLAPHARRMEIPLGSIGAQADDRIRELWTHSDTPHDGTRLLFDLPAHGAALYRLRSR
jgi:hypothetical protein